MKAGFIGAGKVGFTLGRYFMERGVSVTGYFSRNPESAKEAAEFTGTKYFGSLDYVLAASDILFLTVPDNAIETVWDELKALPVRDKMLCHCSGALSSDIFAEINTYGAYGYSVHPLYAIYSKVDSYKEMSQAMFALEGDRRHIDTVKQFIGMLGNPCYVLETVNKVKYHAAAVFLSNHVNALANIGCKLLRDCGFDEVFSEAVLKTLFLNQCKATAEAGPINALTGPIERNDPATVKKHIDCLGEDEANLYILLSRQLIEMSKLRHEDYDYSALEQLVGINNSITKRRD